MGIIPTLNTFVAGTPIVASAMNSNFEAIGTVVNGGLDDSNISQISAEKVTSGQFDPDRIPPLSLTHIPRLTEAKLPQAAQGFLKAKGASVDPAYELVQWGDVQAKPAQATRWPTWSEVTSKPTTFPPSAHTHGAGDIDSGTFAPARVQSLLDSGGTAGTNRVTVNVGRLSGRISTSNMPTSSTAGRFLKVGTANASPSYSSILWGDVQSKPSTFPPSTHTHSAGDINAGRLALGRMPTSSTANRFLKVGTANSDPAYSTVTWNDVQSKPTTFPPSAHSADLLTSGTVPIARLPIGAQSNTRIAPGQAMTGSGDARHPVGVLRLLYGVNGPWTAGTITTDGYLASIGGSGTPTQGASLPGTWMMLNDMTSTTGGFALAVRIS